MASPLSSFGEGRRDRRRLEVERAEKWECSELSQMLKTIFESPHGRVRGLTDTAGEDQREAVAITDETLIEARLSLQPYIGDTELHSVGIGRAALGQLKP